MEWDCFPLSSLSFPGPGPAEEERMGYTPWSQDRYIQAYRFAANAHQGQLVPGTEIAYIMHLSIVSMEVIAALRQEPGSEEDLAVQCALLHDVIEDTEVSYAQV